MLLPKPSHLFSLAIIGVLFALPLSSCNSGDAGPSGSSGALFSAAGHVTVGTAGAGLSASGGPTNGVGGAGGASVAAGGSFASGGGSVVGGTSNNSGGGGTGGMAPACTDKQIPDADHANDPCSIWPEYDAANPPGTAKNCDASWLTGMNYCLKSCGKCSDGSAGTGAGGGSAGGFSTGLGPGPKLPDVNTSNKVMWASRYWDCCKPHCSTNGNIKSCGADGVSQNGGGSACSGGSAYTCYSQAPRAIGDNVSYGYVAVPNPQCGTCYHLQFTGTGQFSANDPGSKALAGKHMIVKVSNTGGDVAGNQFDMMIPGGGVGQNANTCPSQWKVSSSDLGPTQGGFLTGCTGSYAAKRDCVRQKCMLLPDGDLRKGCIWFVDWYAAADNPNFRYESISCPSDI
jgi:glycosyl hydrolase family 45